MKAVLLRTYLDLHRKSDSEVDLPEACHVAKLFNSERGVNEPHNVCEINQLIGTTLSHEGEGNCSPWARQASKWASGKYHAYVSRSFYLFDAKPIVLLLLYLPLLRNNEMCESDSQTTIRR